MRTLVAIIAAIPLLVAGCGANAGPPTTTVAAGTVVTPERYLADTAAAAAAVRAFAVELGGIGTAEVPATPARLRALAPLLDPPLATARLVRDRLSAERLADQRLDRQRALRAEQFAAAVSVMERVRTASAAGDAAAASAAADELRQTLEVLRAPDIREPSGG